MTTPSILVASWSHGVFRITGDDVRHELTDRSVRSLAADGGGALAVVDTHELWRRTADGRWAELARSEHALACCVATGDAVVVGTDDARILRVDRDGAPRPMTGFDTVAGREAWYAGTAIVDGKVMGPPLGVRSLAATCDGAVLLANVHVGGIPRSTDGGATWQPTIAIDADVHQVRAHPTRPELVIAAAAVGLCVSRDRGSSWTIEARGLHATHGSAVAFGRADLLVSAATDPFAARGAVYRRAIDGDGPLQLFGGGLPRWLDRGVDTDCIATRDATIAIIDRSGRLYVSHDDGASWSAHAERFAEPSAVLLI